MRKHPFRFAARLLPIPLFIQVLFAQSAGSMSGEQMSKPPLRIVRASADATVNAKPDHAEIRIGVVTQAPTAQGAAQENARQTTNVVTTLKTAVGENGEVKTTDYSISPQYQYGNNTPPKLTGYRASNTVLVEVDNIASVGSVIDSSVKAGANDVTGISFTLKNDTAMRQQAIAEATTKARANAEAMAKALGVQVIGVVDAETSSSSGVRPIRPMARMMSAMAAPEAVPTPVEAGTLEIQATVTVTLQIQ